jgi:hypothetical protein
LIRTASQHTPSIRLPLAVALVAALALSAAVVSAQPAQNMSEVPDFTSEIDFFAEAGPKKHQKRQGRPIKLGTSGGNVEDFTLDPPFISCCSGTLGALIEKNGEYYILSNNHVLAQINAASPGDPINQPGMLDNACQAPENDYVGELSGFKKLKINGRNKVDAAIASVNEGAVKLDGEILEIGVPGSKPLKPELGMRVQKSGRTTGRTRGEITAVNVAGFVGFPAECSEDAELLSIFFIKQFIVESINNKDFSAGGDSGSLIVEDKEECPRPVGLLFAGGDGETVANYASNVKKQAKKMKPRGTANFVGCEAAASDSTSFTIERGIPELEGRDIRVAERIQDRYSQRMFDLPGVHAMGIGRSSTDPTKPVFKVYVDKGKSGAGVGIPAQLEGVGVEVVDTPQWKALSCPATVTPTIIGTD